MKINFCYIYTLHEREIISGQMSAIRTVLDINLTIKKVYY